MENKELEQKTSERNNPWMKEAHIISYMERKINKRAEKVGLFFEYEKENQTFMEKSRIMAIYPAGTEIPLKKWEAERDNHGAGYTPSIVRDALSILDYIVNFISIDKDFPLVFEDELFQIRIAPRMEVKEDE